MTGFSFLLIALLITGLSILLCIAYISNKVKEASQSVRLLDADFPCNIGSMSKKSAKKYEEFYNRSSSDPRLAAGLIYSKDDIEALDRKASPNRFPKGRYNV